MIDPIVVHELIESARKPARSPVDELTPREREVLSLMARGMSNRAIADELTVNDMVLRYLTSKTDDGLSGEEGTFTICSFWLVSALTAIGKRKRARRLCQKLLSFAGPLGLYAEEIDPHSGRHLGNFPQALTHLALINAVFHVIDAERENPQ